MTGYAKKHNKTLGDVLEMLIRSWIQHNVKHKVVVDERGVILSSTDPLDGPGEEFKKIVDAMPKLYREEDVIRFDDGVPSGISLVQKGR
jgi:hypothetical protein